MLGLYSLKLKDKSEKKMNSKIKVMVNGLPGGMATKVAEHIIRDTRFLLVPYSLTGPEITTVEFTVGSQTIAMVRPDQRWPILDIIRMREEAFISVDFTRPEAVVSNAEFYCRYGIPFVMGTTGGDRKRLNEVVAASAIAAVIAPNMAKQIVGFQAMMEYAADAFPGLFAGYSLKIVESHQASKADTSGTAKVMVKCFTKLGVAFTEDEIKMVRDPDIQKKLMGVPKEHLRGHGWHTYTLVSPDGTVKFEFVHNVNGRDVYARGTLDAIAFLDKKVKEGAKGKVFTMIDVLKG